MFETSYIYEKGTKVAPNLPILTVTQRFLFHFKKLDLLYCFTSKNSIIIEVIPYTNYILEIYCCTNVFWFNLANLTFS